MKMANEVGGRAGERCQESRGSDVCEKATGQSPCAGRSPCAAWSHAGLTIGVETRCLWGTRDGR